MTPGESVTYESLAAILREAATVTSSAPHPAVETRIYANAIRWVYIVHRIGTLVGMSEAERDALVETMS
jgi:hypothetical protein